MDSFIDKRDEAAISWSVNDTASGEASDQLPIIYICHKLRAHYLNQTCACGCSAPLPLTSRTPGKLLSNYPLIVSFSIALCFPHAVLL